MKKKVDSRIQTLIENNIKLHQRSMFYLVGDRSRYQVVNFHYILTKNYSNLRNKPNVLWCYNKDLEFSSHQKKRMKEAKNKQAKGLYDENVDDPFDLFISSTQIRYSYYNETHKILGNTYQMLILQDFEALTPNVLCRTIETVQGGGLIIFLIRSMTSLKQLYTLTMDVHSRYRTEAFQDIEPRFNERFILSLSECKSCIFMDDQLNILPISSHIEQIQPVSEQASRQGINKQVQQEMESLKKQLHDKQVIGSLLQIAKTLDQAKVIMTLVDCLNEKNKKITVSLNAARGRGKSAAIGLGIAAAVKMGFSSIFVTAPNPNNLKTLFEFVVEGLSLLDFKERMDFEKVHSSNKEYDNAIIRINIFKTHTQFIQYVFPTDAQKIGHTDLVVIDEAAAIPLPYIRSFFGPYCIFMASTVNGYEGTGRSLSLKLIQQIKDQNKKSVHAQNSQIGENLGFRVLKEVTMTDPIRYALNDQIQKWLNSLLLLNATEAINLKHGIPHPNDCQLYLVNRDALFSYKKNCEKFLFNLMSLFIASHYKNSPNDLQLLSDSPSHLIFVLVGPLKKGESGKTEMPDILCVIQVALQGNLSSSTIKNNSQRGLKPSGDLIPWNIRQQFQDADFPTLAGGRIVRIATHSMTQKMGYGSRALQLLSQFLEKKMIVVDQSSTSAEMVNFNFKDNNNSGEAVNKPLLKRLEQVHPPQLHYIGTCFGFTTNLVKFWRKNGYQPVYLRQGVNDITAEYSGIMLKPLHNDSYQINIKHYVNDFGRRFMSLLGYEFRQLSPALALEILEYTNRKRYTTREQKEERQLISKEQFKLFITNFDYVRLRSYTNNQSDYHLILDLVPTFTKLYFSGLLGQQNFNYTWEAILVGVGLQHKPIEKVTKEIGQGQKFSISNSLALFHKAMIRCFKISKQIYESEAVEHMTSSKPVDAVPVKENPKTAKQYEITELQRIQQIQSQQIIGKSSQRKNSNPELSDRQKTKKVKMH